MTHRCTDPWRCTICSPVAGATFRSAPIDQPKHLTGEFVQGPPLDITALVPSLDGLCSGADLVKEYDASVPEPTKDSTFGMDREEADQFVARAFRPNVIPVDAADCCIACGARVRHRDTRPDGDMGSSR